MMERGDCFSRKVQRDHKDAAGCSFPRKTAWVTAMTEKGIPLK
jgi:hypothetical protein